MDLVAVNGSVRADGLRYMASGFPLTSCGNDMTDLGFVPGARFS